MTLALQIFWWMVKSQVGRVVALTIVGLIGWFGVAQYYKYQGRAQVYEKIEKDSKKAEKSREKINRKSDSIRDDRLDRWLRDRGSGE